MNKKFWLGKKVFITGHTGFKGSWTSLWLQDLGADVTGFSLDNISNSDLYNCANVSLGMNSIIGDVRNFDSLGSSYVLKSRYSVTYGSAGLSGDHIKTL